MMLYVVRHAWALPRDETVWPDDFDRPLTAEGKRRFAATMKRLAQRGFSPGLVLTSPLVRCHQTAKIIGRRIPQARLVREPALQSPSELARLIEQTATYAPAETDVAWVGHAPDVGQLTAQLIGSPQGQIDFAKGAVAAIEFADRPQAAAGTLRWLVTAKILGL